jgi:hypothetical protein
MIYKLAEQKDKFIESVYKESMRDLDKFYEIGWNTGKPNIAIVETRKQINKLKDVKTEPWVVGWSDNKTVYVLDRNKYEKESNHKYNPETYKALIKHELSHAFYNILSNGKYNPRWLCEGVAIYTSGQNKFKKPIVKFTNFLDFYDNIYFFLDDTYLFYCFLLATFL